MKRLVATLCLAAASLLPAPALASEEDPVTSTALLPFRVAAIGVGMSVGIPVASVKQSAKNIQEHTLTIADSFGGKDDPVSILFAAAPGTAVGLAHGLAEGIYLGSKNALDNCVASPFSSESMSLD